MHVWQGGERAGASEPERGDRTHPGPLAPCGPPEPWARALGSGRGAASRGAGGGACGGRRRGPGREELPARPPLGCTPAGAAPPRDSDSGAARAARERRDRRTAAEKEDASAAAGSQVREARGVGGAQR